MRRIGLLVLVAALVLGGVAVWGLIGLLKSRGPQVATVPVVVAVRSIEFGEALTGAHLRVQPWPANAVPAGAFNDLATLTTGDAHVALRSIEANEPILSSRISGAGGRATLSAAITPGNRAVAIRVNDVIGVGGFVLPGDFVDVLITRQEGSGYSNNAMRTDLLIENVRVLAIDQTASESTDDPQVARAVTIEVTPEDSQKIALASQIGTLSLSLRRANDGVNQRPTGPVRTQDLTSAAARAAAPVRTAVTAPAPRPQRRASGETSIEIVRGFTAARAAVPAE